MSATPGVLKPSAARFAVRVIKLCISLGYFVCNRFRDLFFSRQIGRCVVLYYHNIPARHLKQFERQMQIVAKAKLAIDITTIDNLTPGTHSIVLTFDDALLSFAENAIPVLQRLNIPATAFAVANGMASKPVWGIGYYTPDEMVMSEDQLCNLPETITIGSHTLNHPILTAISPQSSGEEISLSRKKLGAMVQRPIEFFSFPDGMFNSLHIEQCRDAGYKHVFTTEPALIRADNYQFIVGRVAIDPWDWPAEFYLKISGAYCWQPYVKSVRDKIFAALAFGNVKQSADSQNRSSS
jgi:peptidoglycan/xylan/chitin deacetylase (PgdA/CDA1 family)